MTEEASTMPPSRPPFFGSVRFVVALLCFFASKQIYLTKFSVPMAVDGGGRQRERLRDRGKAGMKYVQFLYHPAILLYIRRVQLHRG